MIAPLFAAHFIGAIIWTIAWAIHCDRPEKTFGDRVIGTSVVCLAWEPMMLVLAMAGFVIFIKRMIKEVEDA